MLAAAFSRQDRLRFAANASIDPDYQNIRNGDERRVIRLPRWFALMLLGVLGTHALAAAAPAARAAPVEDIAFYQDYHESYPLPTTAENDVRALALDSQGRV